MFCNQCQETLNVKGCTKNGVCGKKGKVADLQDRLLYVLKSISFFDLKRQGNIVLTKKQPIGLSSTGSLPLLQIPTLTKRRLNLI